MKLKHLTKSLRGAKVYGPRSLEITGVCSDSRRVCPGNLFIARKGSLHDGAKYIPAALSAGASAIGTDLYDPSLKVTQIVASDVSQLEGDCAAAFYQHPSKQLYVVGVTGTNGKTSTNTLIRHLLQPCGLIGSVEIAIGPLRYESTHTTPDVCTVHKILREMVQQECVAATLEVTSHALDQERIRNVCFDVGVFTNLSLDHLDYHQTMDAYGAAKLKLFKRVPRAVVNADDPFAAQIRAAFRGEELLTYGQHGDLRPADLLLDPLGSSFTVRGVPFRIPLIGRHNVANALAAIGVGLFRGHSLKDLSDLLATAPPIAGRLEKIPNDRGLHIYVDFAHTPDALDQSLACLHEVHSGRIVTLFGCGGDRDPTKRPVMGTAAARHSDHVIITSDNPRHEDPEKICAEIAKGVEGSYEIIVDRREAIAKAIASASSGDLILVAGRGHERSQIFHRHTIPFSDGQVVRDLCADADQLRPASP